MSDELKSKIIDDLLKSGFAAELRVLEAFKSADDWDATGGLQFFDPDIQKSREIDVHSLRSSRFPRENGLPPFEVTFEMWIEVKKTEKPWIVLRSQTPDKFLDLSSALCRPQNFHLVRNKGPLVRAVAANSIAMRSGWCGHGIHEAFKSPSDNSSWFTAFKKLSTITRHPEHSAAFFASKEQPHARITQPLVVLDGLMFSAALVEEQIELHAITEAAVDFSISGRETTGIGLHIDVVTMAGLSGYIAQATKTHDELIELMRADFSPPVE